MDVTCKLCGSSSQINKTHKDYLKYRKNPNSFFICEKCSIRIQVEMQNLQEFRKTK